MIKNRGKLWFTIPWAVTYILVVYSFWGKDDFSWMIPVFLIIIWNSYVMHISDRGKLKSSSEKVEPTILGDYATLKVKLGDCISDLKALDNGKLAQLITQLERYYSYKEMEITSTSPSYVFYRHVIPQIGIATVDLKERGSNPDSAKGEDLLLTRLDFLVEMYNSKDTKGSRFKVDLDIVDTLFSWGTLVELSTDTSNS